MIQTVFISYAGGNAGFFEPLIKKFHDQIDCTAIEYTARGSRKKELPYSSFDEMTEDISDKINQRLDSCNDIIIFGYSMGSLVAYEILANEMLIKKPKLLIVAAHYAPTRSSVEETLSNLSDEDLVKQMLKFSPMNRQVFSDKRFWPLILPQIRNDYRLLESYDFDKTKKKLDVDLKVLYSKNDIPFQLISEWKEMSLKDTHFYEFEGDHFFLKNNEERIADIILKYIQTI